MLSLLKPAINRASKRGIGSPKRRVLSWRPHASIDQSSRYCASTPESQPHIQPMPLKVQDLIPYMASKLKKLDSVQNGRLEASILLSLALGAARDVVVTDYKRILTDSEAKKVEQFINQRLTEMPVAYLAGTKDFYGRSFLVSRDTLIPRPATETLISETLDIAREYFDYDSSEAPERPFNVLELGVGTGCVITTLIAELNAPLPPKALLGSLNDRKAPAKWIGTGVDVSSAALKVATQNAKTHLVDHLIGFYESNWTQDLVGKHRVETKYDIIVSNPPYLTDFDWEVAPITMTRFEPSLAFVGGPDGLNCYKQICKEAPAILNPGSLVCLEIGAWQEEGVRSVFTSTGEFSFVKNAKDMDGLMRCLIFKYLGRHERLSRREEARRINSL